MAARAKGMTHLGHDGATRDSGRVRAVPEGPQTPYQAHERQLGLNGYKTPYQKAQAQAQAQQGTILSPAQVQQKLARAETQQFQNPATVARTQGRIARQNARSAVGRARTVEKAVGGLP